MLKLLFLKSHKTPQGGNVGYTINQYNALRVLTLSFIRECQTQQNLANSSATLLLREKAYKVWSELFIA